MIIQDIESLQILDSRGNPTVQVKVVLEDGSSGVFKVPSGASTGIHEACELRDDNKNLYHGKSVEKAVENVYKIKDELIDKDFNQSTLDEELIRIDGTENKSLIGANAILGISIAFAKASAKYYNLPLYEYLYRIVNNIDFKKKSNFELPNIHLFANVINGGLHSGNLLNVQEFMLVPMFGDLKAKVRAISEIYQTLKVLIKEKYGKNNTNVGDEGGFAPEISKCSEALDLLVEAIRKSNYEGQVGLALDAAASDFYLSEQNKYEIEHGLILDYKELTNFYSDLINNYPLISIEDPMAEDDFEGFAYYMKNVAKMNYVNELNGKKDTLVVGDDLLVTNPERISIAVDKKLCSSLLLKINQIGTLTESVKAHLMAKKQGWHTIISHRSGETEDDFIADLAVATESSIKIGAPARSDRVAKYNRLLNIYK